jgi:hypothetical protein
MEIIPNSFGEKQTPSSVIISKDSLLVGEETKDIIINNYECNYWKKT